MYQPLSHVESGDCDKKHQMAQDKVLQEVTVQSQADKSEYVLNWRGHAVRWKDLV